MFWILEWDLEDEVGIDKFMLKDDTRVFSN